MLENLMKIFLCSEQHLLLFKIHAGVQNPINN